MSNNDGAAMAQCIAVGEELSRAMVEVAHLRAENERLRATLDQTRRFALSGEMDTVVSNEIERLRERCTYFYEALHDIALGAHGNDGVEFARKAIGFIKLEFDADKIAAANNLINRAALGEKE